MGKKMDALLGRKFRISKFRPLITLAFSRLVVLKNQRKVKSSQARSDVLQLLQLGCHDRALLRVEQVIKEENMLDVYVMIEGYCNILTERIHLLEQERECPVELKEAIAGLIFASSRCGDFPELQEIRAVLTSRFGKEFAARAVELRNNCGVNIMIIQKLSTRQPGLEIRMKVLKEIASENGIALHLEEASSSIPTVIKVEVEKKQSNEHIENANEFSSSMKTGRKYVDVADAAQAAFESAAHAAAAARAAVELSRSDHHDHDDHSGSSTGISKLSDKKEADNKNESTEGGQSMSNASDPKITRVDSGSETEVGSTGEVSHSIIKELPSKFQSDMGSVGGGLNLERRPISVRTRVVRGY